VGVRFRRDLARLVLEDRRHQVNRAEDSGG